MSEDQNGGRLPPIRTIQSIRTVRTGTRNESTPPIKTLLKSQGSVYWRSLPEETRTNIEGEIALSEQWLINQFHEGYDSPFVLTARDLALLRLPEIQRDPDTCSIVATANTFRVLDDASPAYTQRAIQDRIERLHGFRWTTLAGEDLKRFVDSGSPYNRFQVSQIMRDPEANDNLPGDVLKLLQEIDRGAVATLDWKISPNFPDRTITHARTLVGFSVNQGILFFHIIDPFKGQVEPWSFRDLAAATSEQYKPTRENVISKINSSIGREATIISRRSPLTGI